MAKRSTPTGMIMAPAGGGGGSPPEKKTHPTGEAFPPVEDKKSGGGGGGGGGDEGDDDFREEKTAPDKPMEVVFTTQTFRKLIAWTFGPLLVVLVGGLSAFFYFYHSTSLHVSDPTIHLTRGERTKLETKGEALEERKKLKKEITKHFDVKVREIKVEQREQLHKIGSSLRAEQKANFKKLLTEVKKTRRDIRSH